MAEREKRSTKGQAAAGRKARLAEALRENLKKRKRQTRSRRGKDAGNGSKADQT